MSDPDDITLARWVRKLSRLVGGELDAIGRRLLVGRRNRGDEVYRQALAYASAQLGEVPPAPAKRARATHELQVDGGEGEWKRAAKGSEEEMTSALEAQRARWTHLPARVAPIAKPKPRKLKAWSVRDEDHVLVGARVMLARPAEEIHTTIAAAQKGFGLPPISTRVGKIAYRFFDDGRYVVAIDRTSLVVERADFIFPIPDEVVAIGTSARRGK